MDNDKTGWGLEYIIIITDTLEHGEGRREGWYSGRTDTNNNNQKKKNKTAHAEPSRKRNCCCCTPVLNLTQIPEGERYFGTLVITSISWKGFEEAEWDAFVCVQAVLGYRSTAWGRRERERALDVLFLERFTLSFCLSSSYI